jgi:hypothetical protein
MVDPDDEVVVIVGDRIANDEHCGDCPPNVNAGIRPKMKG